VFFKYISDINFLLSILLISQSGILSSHNILDLVYEARKKSHLFWQCNFSSLN